MPIRPARATADMVAAISEQSCARGVAGGWLPADATPGIVPASGPVRIVQHTATQIAAYAPMAHRDMSGRWGVGLAAIAIVRGVL